MNCVKIYDALTNYLYDKEYYVALFDDKLYVYKYKELSFLATDKIVIQFDAFVLKVKGNNLIIVKMNKDEFMIQGQINDIEKSI